MGAKKCPDKVKMHWYYYLAGTIGPHDIENTSYSLSLSLMCELFPSHVDVGWLWCYDEVQWAPHCPLS